MAEVALLGTAGKIIFAVIVWRSGLSGKSAISRPPNPLPEPIRRMGEPKFRSLAKLISG